MDDVLVPENEVEALLRLPDLQASMGPRLHVMETSATTGSGVDALLAWLALAAPLVLVGAAPSTSPKSPRW